MSKVREDATVAACDHYRLLSSLTGMRGGEAYETSTRRRVAVVEIGLTFTPINVAPNNASAEKAVAEHRDKGVRTRQEGMAEWWRQRRSGRRTQRWRKGRAAQGKIETGLLILE